MKAKYIAAIALAAFALGFLLGRAGAEAGERVEYVRGGSVTGSVSPDYLTAKVEFKTDVKFSPYMILRDTVMVVDTVRIVEDYFTKREYDFTVFDDDNGTLRAMPSVLHNRLSSFDYSFTPVHKVVTRTVEPKFTPFVSGSYSTLNTVGAGGGIFINDLGFEYQYVYNYISRQTGHTLGVKMKF